MSGPPTSCLQRGTLSIVVSPSLMDCKRLRRSNHVAVRLSYRKVCSTIPRTTCCLWSTTLLPRRSQLWHVREKQKGMTNPEPSTKNDNVRSNSPQRSTSQGGMTAVLYQAAASVSTSASSFLALSSSCTSSSTVVALFLVFGVRGFFVGVPFASSPSSSSPVLFLRPRFFPDAGVAGTAGPSCRPSFAAASLNLATR
jgi:hypothetical protein